MHNTSVARSNYSPIANSVHNGPIHSFTASADCETPDSRFRQRNQPRLNLLDGVFQRPANFASSAPPPSETTGQRLVDGGGGGKSRKKRKPAASFEPFFESSRRHDAEVRVSHYPRAC